MKIASLLFLVLAFAVAAFAQQCAIQIKPAPLGKTMYRVGILANRGIETVYKEWNATSEYLTKTAGTLFDPPISFESVPVVFDDNVLDELASGKYDFIFANPTITSCVSSEVGSQSLNTLVAKRNVGGSTYDLSNFGGVIITQANNDEVNTIQDLKDKRIGLISISGLGR